MLTRIKYLLTGVTCALSPLAENSASAVTVDGPLVVATDFGPPVVGGSLFGSAIAVDGETAVVGSSTQEAIVYIRSSASRWDLSAALPMPLARTTFTSYFVGDPVAVDDGAVLLGESQAAVWPNEEQGEVDSYALQDENWRLRQNLFDFTTGTARDHFGSAVATDGAELVVGASTDGSLPGVAYSATLVGGIWQMQQRIAPFDGAVGDGFGTSVAIEGDTIVVGASSATDDSASKAGVAYVYAFVGGTWKEVQKFSSTHPVEGGSFGAKVATSGNWIAVAAPCESVGTVNIAGYVYLFQRSGEIWKLKQVLSDPIPSNPGAFGSALDLKKNQLVVGELGADRAIVYELVGSVWTKYASMTGNLGGALGASAAISESTGEILVGAPFEHSHDGHVYIFENDEIFSDGYEP